MPTIHPRPAPLIKPIEDNNLLGIAMVLIALTCFTGIDVSAKWLVLSGLPSLEVVFARYAVHFLLVIVFLAPAHGKALVMTNRPKLEILRALVLLASTILNFIAVRYLPLSTTASIIFAMPLILCALSVPLLGEHVGWRRWIAILVGFSGVLIIIRPGGADFHWAMLLSLSATFCYAIYNILNRKLAGIDSAFTQQFYAAGIATFAILPIALSGWTWPHDPRGWLAFCAMGMFGFAGHLLVTIAHRLAPASTLAPFTYVQILPMTAASWLVFAQPPTVWVFIGAPIVVGSGLYIWLRERQMSVKRRLSPTIG